MHKRLLNTALHYRLLVVLALIMVTAVGVHQYNSLPVDAFPDISPVMVPVFTEADGMAPEEVERLITFPVESVMNGLPGVTQIKSTSAFGMSVVYVYFEDDMDIYFARQLVNERLGEALAQMPDLQEKPKLGPISTGLGQIFIYYLTIDDSADTEGKDPLSYLRDLNDWVVKYQLQTVRGVTDILSVGGHVLQYQVNIKPDMLLQYGLSIHDVTEAIRQNNGNVGGQYIITGSEENLVRGIGLLNSLEDISNVIIDNIDGTPVRVMEVADVEYGRAVRRGIVSRNGGEEVVSGIVLQLYGENASNVIERLYAKLPDVQKSLPEGVRLVPYYEQQEIVQRATWTVKSALLTGAVLAAIVLFAFIGNFRSAMIVVFALPFSGLVSIILMQQADISANLMSLGGIAIAMGMLVDGAIVMVENIYRHLNVNAGDDIRSRTAIIIDAAYEVARPVTFSLLIVIVVFVPILTLQGAEGQMFIPMSYTLCFALLGSLIFAVLAVPALASYLMHVKKHKEFFIFVILQKLHDPLLRISVKHPVLVLMLVLALLCGSGFMAMNLGTEFIPTLEEGSIMIGVNMAPSIALEEAAAIIKKLETRIIALPEVEEVVSRIGRPEAGSHPHPVNYAEVHIELHPEKEWTRLTDKAELVEELEENLSDFPGIQLNFTQPIQNAFDELVTGVRSQVAVKVFGEDLDILQSKATEIRNSIDNIEGLVDLSVEQSFGQPQVQVIVDRRACAAYGVNAGEILELVETAIGGQIVDHVYLNTRRYGIQIRYTEDTRDNIHAIKSLLVPSRSGQMLPLSQLAEVREDVGSIQINRENNQRRWIVQGNVRGRDLGGVVGDIRRLIAEKIELPDGYHIEYGGQYESQMRAMRRLGIIVPVVGMTVLLMLYLAFGSIKSGLLVMVNIPLGLIGGVAGLYVMGEYISVPAAVGFIALFGIAVQDSMVLVSAINQLRREGVEMVEAVITGCHQRFRPVLMTSITTVLGLLPLLLSTGIGADVQRPLAAVVIFGIISSTLLTLFVIPAFYKWFAVRPEMLE
ncbi:Cation efflux system protein CzcA [Limihaloglobus sulfuriphilus]|uniref:Cation efflux system protein CzcA n=1 Tax=Limihaloglobus sulfuriphilus TaxID=1851148 RepID=A0A1Q2MGS2_9BACT|nr:CusA/CzcA family heavy metal efflux RND transporter [Limihaloglobus sulfuriphilus]AQQ71849.1 Cation efflux system protein CzcA [Limihaloglobus sulfuriphilus]